MIEKDTLIKVLNRDNGSVGYDIPDLGNLHRNFESQEVKEITMEELRKLSYLPGGQYLLENCLMVQNEEALKELFIDVEPEYFYTEDNIKDILLKGTLEEFLDCLDFAPNGVIELIKSLAVELKINDIAKRKAILEKTNFDVTAAIDANEAMTEDDKEEGNEERQRRAPSPKAGDRRTAPYRNVTILNKK